MKLIFCGTPAFAVPSLQALIDAGHQIALVVTQPDRPAGRGLKLHAPPVKQLALQHNLPITQPEKIKTNEDFRKQLESIQPDAIVVVAYGRIIPKWMLDLPRLGNINVHASLLPKYRGAAPIQWSIANGDTVTGVTTMLLAEGLDTGPMLLQAELPIGPDDTSPQLFESLSIRGAKLLIETLSGLEARTITPQPQNEAEATLAPILTKEDGRLRFDQTAQWNYNRYRAFQPWPGAYTTFRGKKLSIHRITNSMTGVSFSPGTLLFMNNVLIVSCAMGTALRFEEVQLEGKRRMSAAEFRSGYQIPSSELIG